MLGHGAGVLGWEMQREGREDGKAVEKEGDLREDFSEFL